MAVCGLNSGPASPMFSCTEQSCRHRARGDGKNTPYNEWRNAMIRLTENPTEVRIKNIGRLDDVEILLSRFTVFAGPNNTGKSFASKLIYSFLSAMISRAPRGYLRSLSTTTYFAAALISMQYEKETQRSKSLARWVEQIRVETERMGIRSDLSFISLPEIISNLSEATNRLISLFLSAPKTVQSSELLNNALTDARELKNKLKEITPENVVVDSILNKINNNIITNFQVPTLSGITNSSKKLSEIMISGIGGFKILSGNISFNNGNFFPELSELYLQEGPNPRVIYLESPIYWKLKGALEEISFYRTSNTNSESLRLSGVPGHFIDLREMLKHEYIGDIEFPEVYSELTNKNIGGKISLSQQGDLLFQEKGRTFSLHATATGIANLGILALLIERKVLNKGSFLFIDEPEAHLHPAWQGYMAENLFELARQGVNIVIATHSIDILKWLEVHAKKDPEYKSLIALNQFPIDNEKNRDDFEKKIDRIIYDLTKPFTDLYIEGI